MAAEIVPDDKDWTWVLERRCPECGFEAATFDLRSTSGAIRANAQAWQGVLDQPLDDLRRRRQPDRWSTLEYAAHVRDVYRLYLFRLELMLGEDDPLFPNWDQDATAIEARYRDEDPSIVCDDLVDAASRIADAFDLVDEAGWARSGRRSDGAAFTIESFARYLIHDPVHHLWDVGQR